MCLGICEEGGVSFCAVALNPSGVGRPPEEVVMVRVPRQVPARWE